MTIGAWLDARRPAPPENLAARVRRALDGSLEQPDGGAIASCIRAAESLLISLCDDPDAGREVALDLLAADALMTYAFEAAAEEPISLIGFAQGAMWRVGQLAEELDA
jgi:hypothetical protein